MADLLAKHIYFTKGYHYISQHQIEQLLQTK